MVIDGYCNQSFTLKGQAWECHHPIFTTGQTNLQQVFDCSEVRHWHLIFKTRPKKIAELPAIGINNLFSRFKKISQATFVTPWYAYAHVRITR